MSSKPRFTGVEENICSRLYYSSLLYFFRWVCLFVCLLVCLFVLKRCYSDKMPDATVLILILLLMSWNIKFVGLFTFLGSWGDLEVVRLEVDMWWNHPWPSSGKSSKHRGSPNILYLSFQLVFGDKELLARQVGVPNNPNSPKTPQKK